MAGHLHASTAPGKTRFPATWSENNILDAVDLAMANPDSVRHQRDQFVFKRLVNGRIVSVTVRVDKPNPFVWTAYPLP